LLRRCLGDEIIHARLRRDRGRGKRIIARDHDRAKAIFLRFQKRSFIPGFKYRKALSPHDPVAVGYHQGVAPLDATRSTRAEASRNSATMRLNKGNDCVGGGLF